LTRAITAVEEWQSDPGRAPLTCPRGHRLVPEVYQNMDVILVCPRCRGVSQGMPPEVMAGYAERRSRPVADTTVTLKTLKFRTIVTGGLTVAEEVTVPATITGGTPPPLHLIKSDRDDAGDVRPRSGRIADMSRSLNALSESARLRVELAERATHNLNLLDRNLVDRSQRRPAARTVLKVRAVGLQRLDSLSGRQQIGGVRVEPGDLVLLAAQRGEMTQPSAANGVYRVRDGDWEKEHDLMTRQVIGDNVQATEGLYRQFVLRLAAADPYFDRGVEKNRYRYDWDLQAQGEQYLSSQHPIGTLFQELARAMEEKFRSPEDPEEPPPAA
jgi:hypothetical protein